MSHWLFDCSFHCVQLFTHLKIPPNSHTLQLKQGERCLCSSITALLLWSDVGVYQCCCKPWRLASHFTVEVINTSDETWDKPTSLPCSRLLNHFSHFSCSVISGEMKWRFCASFRLLTRGGHICSCGDPAAVSCCTFKKRGNRSSNRFRLWERVARSVRRRPGVADQLSAHRLFRVVSEPHLTYSGPPLLFALSGQIDMHFLTSYFCRDFRVTVSIEFMFNTYVQRTKG